MEPVRFTSADLGLIHALGMLSRPYNLDADKIMMVVDMLEKFTLHASRDTYLIRPLVAVAERFVSFAPSGTGRYGSLHDDAARAMNTFDALRLGQAWDRLQAKKHDGGEP